MHPPRRNVEPYPRGRRTPAEELGRTGRRAAKGIVKMMRKLLAMEREASASQAVLARAS